MRFLINTFATFFGIVTIFSSHLLWASEGNGCETFSVRSLVHFGDHHVQPFTNAEVRIVYENFNAARVFEMSSPIGVDGRARFNKAEFRNFIRQEAGNSWDGILTVAWKVPATTILNLSFVNWFTNFYLSGSRPNPEYVTENPLATRSFFSPENCSEFVPTVRGQWVDQSQARAIRGVFGALWALEQARSFLEPLAAPHIRNDRRQITAQYWFDWDNGAVTNPTDPAQPLLLQLGAQTNRPIFLTLHELGHAMAINFLSIEVLGGEHTSLGCYPPALALGEGFAHFFAMSVLRNHNANLPASLTDQEIFAGLTPNFPSLNPMNGFLVDMGRSSACPQGLVNERNVKDAFLGLVRQGGLSFAQIWAALQLRGNTKISTFEQVVQILVENHPHSTDRIRGAAREHGF